MKPRRLQRLTTFSIRSSTGMGGEVTRGKGALLPDFFRNFDRRAPDAAPVVVQQPPVHHLGSEGGWGARGAKGRSGEGAKGGRGEGAKGRRASGAAGRDRPGGPGGQWSRTWR